MYVDVNDFSQVVPAIMDSWNVSSQEVWDVINTYNLTPSQLSEMIPEMATGSDGVVKIFNKVGKTTSYVNYTNIPFSDGGVSQSVINSNVQDGVSSLTYKTAFPGNSVIDSNGKIVTESGLTKFSAGQAVGKVASVLTTVASTIGAASVGASLGKKIDSALYNANPAFWNSIGLSTLNPQTWNSLTVDMPDPVANVINWILGLNPDGSVQPYINAEAYKYMAYALASVGVFNQGDTTYEKPSTSGLPWVVANTINKIRSPITVQNSYYVVESQSAGYHTVTADYGGNANVVIAESGDGGKALIYLATEPTAIQYRYGYVYDSDPSGEPSQWYIATRYINDSYPINGVNYYYKYYSIYDSRSGYPNYKTDGLNAMPAAWTYIWLNGAPIIEPAVPGISNQPGAVVPTGINDSSTQQQVSDYIDQNYPDLENNRLEQTVVQPDGTVDTIKYYPVPMPNAVTDVTTEEDTDVTLDQPLKAIIPDGKTITLPNGESATGDGVTPIIIPAGNVTIPQGTVIPDQIVTDMDQPQGTTQQTTEINDDTTPTLTKNITKMLLDYQPSPFVNPQTSPQTSPQTTTDPVTPTPTNPSDIGEGQTPPVVVPTSNASALWSVYNPSLAQINALGAWLWSSNFIDQLLKMFNDPMQAIIGLHKTFIPPVTGGSQNIKVGYLDSGVNSLTVPVQYSEVDCGTVKVPEYFGNVFDYTPYTRIFIYLPFIGFKELDVSQVMRSSISVKYKGDAFTGTGLCEVSVIRDREAGGVLYTYACDVAARYPLSHGSYMGMVGGIAALAGTAVGALMGMPAMGIGAMASVPFTSRNKVELSGNFSGNAGAMGSKVPYLVIMRPQTAMPRNYEHYSGIPSSATINVSEATGLIRVRECHVESIYAATKEEKDMIENALKTGVII